MRILIQRFLISLITVASICGCKTLTFDDEWHKASQLCSDKQYYEAISHLNHCIQLNPEAAQPYELRAQAYFETKQYDEAMTDCNKAIQLNPKLAAAYVVRASIYKIKGNMNALAKDCEQAVSLNPRLIQCWIDLGFIRIEQEEWAGAEEAANQAIQIDKDNYSACEIGSIAELHLGKPLDSLADAEKLIALNASNANGYIRRSYARLSLGQLGLAHSDADKALTLCSAEDAAALRATEIKSIINKYTATHKNVIKDAAQAFQLESTSH